MSLSSYELKYFFYRAKAEPIRWLLKYLQVPFKDTIIDRWNDWPNLKNNMPFKQVPVLIVDNKLTIAQSTAIMRYLAKRHGLEVKTFEEQALCDMYAEHAQDVFEKLRPWVITFTRSVYKEFLNQREEKTKNLFFPVISQGYGPIFEKRLNETGSGFLIGDQLTWVDIFLGEFTDKLLTYGPNEAFEDYPLLKAHRKMVSELPGIKEHVQTRPVYVF